MLRVADSPLVPDDIEAIDAFLNAFAMSRALRELDWELTVRPERSAWIDGYIRTGFDTPWRTAWPWTVFRSS
jgi:hypothetical protein